MFLAVVSAGVMISEKHPGDVVLLGASSPLPASQPPRSFPGERLPRAAGGHWLGMGRRAGPVLRGSRERCPELSERLRHHRLAGGRRCRVLADPPRAGSRAAARGRASACELPLQAWFLPSPSISAGRPCLPCGPTVCLPEALPLRRLNGSNFPPSLGRWNVCLARPALAAACCPRWLATGSPRRGRSGPGCGPGARGALLLSRAGHQHPP